MLLPLQLWLPSAIPELNGTSSSISAHKLGLFPSPLLHIVQPKAPHAMSIQGVLLEEIITQGWERKAREGQGGVRHRYCSAVQLSTVTENRRMELALQPSLLTSLCWRKRDGGSAMMGKRVGGRGSS